MDRLEAALAMMPEETLPELARELRDGGMSQADLLALFDAARERHESDADETAYDAILHTMDLIVGYCAASHRIYPDPEP
jgi:hypothetical protein